MKLYDCGLAPNPRRVRIYLAEKGIAVSREQVDLGTMQQKSAAYTAINPLQRVPALVLDDGTVIAESIAICRYFEALNPTPAMFGVGALEQAVVEMWNRQIEHCLFFPLAQVFRHLHPAMRAMEVPQIASWGEANKPRVMAFLPILERQLQIGPFICGAHYSVADITTLVAVDFMKPAKLAVPPEHTNIAKWHAKVSARPSRRGVNSGENGTTARSDCGFLARLRLRPTRPTRARLGHRPRARNPRPQVGGMDSGLASAPLRRTEITPLKLRVMGIDA